MGAGAAASGWFSAFCAMLALPLRPKKSKPKVRATIAAAAPAEVSRARRRWMIWARGRLASGALMAWAASMPSGMTISWV